MRCELGMADDPGVPADAGAHQHSVAVREKQLEDLDQLDACGLRYEFRGLLQQRLEIISAKRMIPEPR